MMTEELKSFYPTPEELIKLMVSKIEKTKYQKDLDILEPSAGRGDIADYLKKSSYWENGFSANSVDCIEINENLQRILNGKEHTLIFDDFLNFSTNKRYDLIIMNPPFNKGDLHLLKAIELMKKTGGQIICILNAETIKNPYSLYRQDLKNKLEKYEAEIEYHQEIFKNADRETNVEIALVNIKIEKEKKESRILEAMRKEEKEQFFKSEKIQAVTSSELIERLIESYNFEIQVGLKFINEYEVINEFSEESFTAKYPQKVFNLNFYDNLYKMRNYEFNMFNIKQLLKNLSNEMISSLEESIVALFDEFSKEHHWHPESEDNVHYYNGWYTNKSYYVNKKVIIPMNCTSYYDREFRFDYSVKSKITDIHKIFMYLDNSEEKNISSIEEIGNILSIAERNQTNRNIDFTYFTISLFKKGTCHIKFKSEDLLLKFNIYGSQKKNWLPPGYGKKKYKEMTEEEKTVINDFQGEESYEKVCNNTDEYLFQASTKFLLE
ncbi:DUF4942 domain-containing protein [Fusobacterium varium]|uniref:DUF4942 domain-containing protein n=1 Tax=Fusobacterium varium TaxID=856 RepID=UPI00266CB846|nr:DUF4942 domain-containing protein [Fusobacterium varium]